jgi:hypothetical protein
MRDLAPGAVKEDYTEGYEDDLSMRVYLKCLNLKPAVAGVDYLSGYTRSYIEHSRYLRNYDLCAHYLHSHGIGNDSDFGYTA